MTGIAFRACNSGVGHLADWMLPALRPIVTTGRAGKYGITPTIGTDCQDC